MNSMDMTVSGSIPAGDASLLEGLYQLVLDGATDGWEFEQLNAEVYERLQATYQADAGRAPALLAG